MSALPAERRRWAVRAYGPAQSLELLTEPMPSPLGPNDVLVKVLVTTATYTDLLIINGNYRPAQPLPATPGYDCIGDVVAVGAKVRKVSVGDRVASMPQGTCMATHVVLREDQVYKARTDVEPEAAINVVLTGITAYQMLHRLGGEGRLKPTSRILIHGCTGGTGAMLVHLAKIAGVPAGNIYGTCSARNVTIAQGMGINALPYDNGSGSSGAGNSTEGRTATGTTGATASGNATTTTSTAATAAAGPWWARLMAATGGEGVDLVFDAVMLGGYYGHGVSCLRRGGKYIAYGVTRTDAPGIVPIPQLLPLLIRLWSRQALWSWVDGRSAEFYNVADRRAAKPAEFASDLSSLLDIVAAGKLHPLVGKVWPFEQAKDALLSIQGNAHHGKQLIRVA